MIRRIDFEHQAYCRSEPTARRTRIGRIDYDHDRRLERPEDRAPEASEEMAAWARSFLEARLPETKERTSLGGLTSWYTLTPDAMPVIGPIPGIRGSSWPRASRATASSTPRRPAVPSPS